MPKGKNEAAVSGRNVCLQDLEKSCWKLESGPELILGSF